MTDDTADRETLELLHALGRVPAPDTAIVVAARESLWTAIIGELLSPDPADDVSQARQPEAQRPAARPRPGQAPSARRLRGDGSD
jgi:hypothetical protein